MDLAANAESLGAHVHRVSDRASLDRALLAARAADRTTVIVVPVDPLQGVPSYQSWWNVPVAEVSTQDDVRDGPTPVGRGPQARALLPVNAGRSAAA